MLIDTAKLWESGGYAKDNPYDRSMKYVYKVSDEEKIPKNKVDKIIFDFFMELSDGKKYPTDKCPCGCGIDKSGTAAVHAIIKRVRATGSEIRMTESKQLEHQINTMILNHISKQNEQYTDGKLKVNPLLDWGKSPVIRGIKWINSKS